MIYIVFRDNFDSYENHNPISSDLLGYVDDYHKACIIITKFIELDKKEKKTYNGYNGVEYPRYYFKKAKKMSPTVGNVGAYREKK